MSLASSPLEKLVKLIADESRLDDKIRDTQATLTLVKKRVSESLAQHYISTRESRIQLPEDLMREEQSYERLLQALQDMKSEIAKQIRRWRNKSSRPTSIIYAKLLLKRPGDFRNVWKKSTITSWPAGNTCRTTSASVRVSAGLTKSSSN